MPGIITKKRFVITGTSGTGKTSIINSLRNHGLQCFDEPVRDILAHQLSIDGPALPSKNALLFVEEILNRSIKDYSSTDNSLESTFFDRGIPDTIAYARRFGIDCKEFERASKKYPYEHTVFILPPWEEIFINDEARKASFEEYMTFHDLIKTAYQDSGYRLLDVPKLPLKARVDFILSTVKQIKKP